MEGVTSLFNLATVFGLDRKSIMNILIGVFWVCRKEVVYVLLWQFFKDDLTKFIESQVKNIRYVY